MNTTFDEITLNLQKKYNKMNELQDVTKQMADSLQRNDLYAFELVMKMRTEVMLEIDSIDYAREDLLKSLPESDEEAVRSILHSPVAEKQLENPVFGSIYEIYKKITRCLESTIQYDQAINLKIGGENSFYKR